MSLWVTSKKAVFERGVVILMDTQNLAVNSEGGETGAIDQENPCSFFLRYVPIAKRIVKSLFDLRAISRSIAVTVLANKGMYQDAILMAPMVRAQISEEMPFLNAHINPSM